jgi:hypothetical protein
MRTAFGALRDAWDARIAWALLLLRWHAAAAAGGSTTEAVNKLPWSSWAPPASLPALPSASALGSS